tara:strand:- start:1923 stop:2285 length:363 start_codon:yes stop_codon:yes gene_type:complete
MKCEICNNNRGGSIHLFDCYLCYLCLDCSVSLQKRALLTGKPKAFIRARSAARILELAIEKETSLSLFLDIEDFLPKNKILDSLANALYLMEKTKTDLLSLIKGIMHDLREEKTSAFGDS